MLCIRLLGTLEVTYKDQPLKLPVLPRTVPLWAYLLLHRGSVMPRTTLAYTLWPEQPEALARTNLARHLHQLRRALPAATTNLSPKGGGRVGDWLVTTTSTVLWQTQPDTWLDVAEFERLSQSRDTLAAAVQLYRGDLLTSVYDDWLFYERERLRDLYLSSLERLAQDCRARRDYPAAIAYIRQLLAADPLHESGVRLLMSVRYEAGDRASALADYERFVVLLGRELDVAPMPETVAVYEAIAHNTNLPGAVSAISPTPLTAAPTEAARSRPALPFVGRQDELERLSLAWSRAAHGHGGISIIAGEAGIGKTRLVGELAQLAEAQGARILRGNATLAEPVPYQAIVTALRSALPMLAALESDAATLSAIVPLLPELATRRPDLKPLPRIDPQRERDRLYQALAATLHRLAEPRPLLLVLEDLHWAGAATIDLLEFLARQAQNQPILIVATYREEEVRRSHPLRLLYRRLAQEGSLLHLTLNRLSADETAALVRRVPKLADASDAQVQELHDESEGNPFFLGELILSQLEADADVAESTLAGHPLPSGVQRIISERIARLPVNTRLIAEVAAIAGTAFNLELIREVAGWDEGETLTALDELLDRGLVREAGRRSGYDYAFTHHLIQETIHNAIDQMVRKRRHRRLALVLEEIYPERQEELALELATHFDQGDDPARAVPYYQQAARRAVAVYAMAEALAACSRAIELATDARLRFDSLALRADIHHQLGKREAEQSDLEQMTNIADDLADDVLVCQVLTREIRLQSVLGNREAEATLIARLIDLAKAADNHRYLAAALLARATYHFHLSQYPLAEADANAALKLYQELGDRDARVECYCLLAHCAVHQDRYSDTHRLLEQASAIATSDNRRLLVKILKPAIASAMLEQKHHTAHQLARQLLDICLATHDLEAEADAHGQLASAAGYLQHTEEAFTHFELARSIFATLGKRQGEAAVLGNMGTLMHNLHRYAEAIAAYRKAMAIYKSLKHTRGQVIGALNIANSAMELGDYATAKTSVKHGLKLAKTIHMPLFFAHLLSVLGIAEMRQGELAAAIQHLEASHATLSAMTQYSMGQEHNICQLVLAYLKTDNLDLARQRSEEGLALYQTYADSLVEPHHVWWMAALVQRKSGNQALAQQYLSESYAILEKRLAAATDEEWRNTELDYIFNGDILAAYERGEWPDYAAPAA